MPGYYLERPLVMAHRGARDSAPENTMAAFRAALDAGADAIELDVKRCATGEVVVIHDATVDRTTDGSGRVADLTLYDLRALDAGSWFAPAFAGEPIPLLSEVLDWAHDRIRLNIEIKDDGLQRPGLEQEIAAMLQERCLGPEQTLICSFDPGSLWRMRRAAPELPRGLLYTEDRSIASAQRWPRWLLRPEALHPYYAMVDDEYLAWARRTLHRVNVWTVNEAEDIRRMLALGVDGVITDHPTLARQLLDE